MSSARDYTDSESDGDTPRQSTYSTPAAESESRNASPSKSEHPLRITLRPGMQHLDTERESDSQSPPPIRLKLKHTREMASYSSSEEENPNPNANTNTKAKAKDRSPPAKKQKTKRAKKEPKEQEAKDDKDTKGSPTKERDSKTMPAQHRKTYDWLQPSSASASHHGPPERERHASSATVTADEATPVPGSSPAPPDEKKPAKKKRRSEPGPGKNWRKGLKKGDPRPPHLTDGIRSSPLSARNSVRGSVSRDATPDIDAMLLATATATAADEREREASPPFVLADPKTLGIPVFSKPIATPKITLGPFPKVTQFFAPFDTKPFKKEKVRDWNNSEKSIVGVGGGTLKFKTWTPGPQSELGVVLQAQKEAEALAKAKKKEFKEKENATPQSSETPERPGLPHSLSSDNLSIRAGSVDDDASEAGDEETSLAPSRESPAPKGRRKPAKPRKSKLAQEIIPDPVSPATSVKEE